MKRALVALWLVLACVLAPTQAFATGGTSSNWTGWARRPWIPRDIPGAVADSWAVSGVTLHTVPRATGTTPPVLTLGGTLKTLVFPYIRCDGAGILGAATYKVSYDDGATFPYTGILTNGTPTALPGPGSAITASFAAGAYLTDQLWEPIVAQVDDETGHSNHATQATSANMMYARAVGFNGKPALESGANSARAYALPAMTIGPFAFFAAVRGDASSAFLMQQLVGTNGAHIYSVDFWSTKVNRGGTATANTTARDVSSTWLTDGTRKTIAMVYNGTHASHQIYVNGANANAATGANSGGTPNNDPGTTPVASMVHYIGNISSQNQGFRGLICGWTLLSSAAVAADVAVWHSHVAVRCPL